MVKDFIIVHRVEDFDRRVNLIFSEEKKLYLRNLFCSGCEKMVMMNDTMFEDYNDNPAPEKIICLPCAIKKTGGVQIFNISGYIWGVVVSTPVVLLLANDPARTFFLLASAHSIILIGLLLFQEKINKRYMENEK